MRISDWSSDVCSSDLNEHARPQPLKGRETMVETISRRPRRIGNVAPAAQMPFADMRGVIARALQQPRDVGQLGVEPVGLSDRPIIGTVADIVDETDLGGEPPGEPPGASRRPERPRANK